MAPANDHLNLLKSMIVQFERKDLFTAIDWNKVMNDLEAPTVTAVLRRWERLYNTMKEMDSKGEKFENAAVATPKAKVTPKKRKANNDNTDPDAVPATPTKKSRGRPKKVNAMTVEQVEADIKKPEIANSGAEEEVVVEEMEQ